MLLVEILCVIALLFTGFAGGFLGLLRAGDPSGGAYLCASALAWGALGTMARMRT